MVQMGAVICAALGVDTDLTLIYQLFALLLCLIVFSRLTLSLRSPHVSVKRRLPRYATAGEPLEYYIEIVNEGDQVENDLTLIDNPKVRPPTIEQFRSEREPGEETRNAYDRWLGFHRFMWLQRINTGITVKQQAAPEIALKSRASVRFEALPLRRGVVQFTSITVLHPDPLGLNYGITNFADAQQLLVLPRRYHIPAHFELPGGRHFQPGGINATWSIGESDEFVSLRDYRDGDSMRKIHWPSTARRQKPVVKEYQDEYFVRQGLVLDTASDNADVLEEAVSVAASFALKVGNADSMVDLLYLSRKPEIVTSGRGNTNVNHQLEALAGARRTDLPIEDLAELALRQAPLLSGCIVVLCDWCDARRSLVEGLRNQAMPLRVLLVVKDEPPPGIPAYVHVLEAGSVAEGLRQL